MKDNSTGFRNHTPGHWVVCEPYTNRAVFPIGYVREDGAIQIIAEVNSQGGTPDKQRANAELIAAAPDLLQMRNKLFEEVKRLRAEANTLLEQRDSFIAALQDIAHRGPLDDPQSSENALSFRKRLLQVHTIARQALTAMNAPLP